MKKEQGITLVALVVSIIILIILAGISLNVTIGENGIITKAKQAKQNITLAGEAEALQLNQLYYELETGGELTEDEESSKKDEIISLLQKQVEELQKQIASLQTENTELKQQIETLTSQITSLQKELEELKVQIAEKDIEIAELKKQLSEKEAKIQELQNQLNNLNSLLSQTNSTADKILAGYKAYSGGKLLTGTMVNQGAVSSNLNGGQSYTIPAGYHNGSGKIIANSLASQTSATATSEDILTGKTAWVNGIKLTGSNKGYETGYNDGYSESSDKEYKIIQKGANSGSFTLSIPANTKNAILILFSNISGEAYPTVTCSSSGVSITTIGQQYANYTTDRGNCTRVYYITNTTNSSQSLQCNRNGYGWTFTGMLLTK
jgi:peptidoglycan hydrolase CwlO-like protein